MKRSTWIAVLLTAAVLVAAGNLPRLRWNLPAATSPAALVQSIGSRLPRAFAARAPRALAPSSIATTHVTTSPLAHFTPPSLLVSRMPTTAHPMLALPSLALVGGSLFIALLAMAALITWRMRGDRRGLVFQMARRGLPTSRIARHARVPQDAVRTLLTPGMGSRR